MTALVLVEHHGGAVAAATRAVISAAYQAAGEVHLLVCGYQLDGVVGACKSLDKVSKVLIADAAHLAHPLAEDLTPIMVALSKNYSHVIAPATTFGKDVLPRVAALLGVAQVSDVIKVESADTFVHPVYAGNALETVQMSDAIKLLTVRATAFDKVTNGSTSAGVETVSVGAATSLAQFVSERVTKSERPELTSANIVVTGGRGVGSKENFAIIEQLADKLGGAVGASRAAVDAGFISNDHQVGQTGKVVAPSIYFAIGVSGAIQHLAGMKDSKVIVAINKDENAPIFEVADYGLVADLFDAIPQIIATT